ncbi:MAG TPA: 50S ribosomal protein L6 [Gemmatimonadota bacterium]|nr:50S ribosomal protein L6 [Gemmatimonadota bacterium]
MSRIGRTPIPIPEKVQVSIEGPAIRVSGPKGEVAVTIPERITASLEDRRVVLNRAGEEPRDKALHGLARSLVANMVEGVTRGFVRRLEITGVGYRAEAGGRTLKLSLGFSHPVLYPVPEGIEVATPQPTQIEVRGADKQMVGQVASEIRAFRPSEPYKGKGIRYEGEQVRRKAGKTGV